MIRMSFVPGSSWLPRIDRRIKITIKKERRKVFAHNYAV
jgi:hypothetical protein